MIPRRLHPLGWPLLALLLSGCLGMLIGGKPNRLYRFGAPVVTPTVAPPAPSRLVVLSPTIFASDVAGARVLTVEGQETSYLKGVRWVSPAPLLFDGALKAGFAARAPWLALAAQREKPGGDSLQVSIDRFEASYAGGPGTGPVIRLTGSAVLIDGTSSERIATLSLSEAQPAANDRVEAVVKAFDAAVGRAVGQVADWTAAAESRRPVKRAELATPVRHPIIPIAPSSSYHAQRRRAAATIMPERRRDGG